MKKTTLAVFTATATLAVPAAAAAHITLQPTKAPAGSFSRMDVRVPNERDDKGTVRVAVRLPKGLYFLSYQKVPGWKTTVYKRKLARPVDLGGFSVDERYTRVVWQARKPRHRIAPGQFQDFPLSVRVPDGPVGSQLVFRAFQTYQGGERVRWTGAPNADTPAPRVTLLAPEEE